MKKALATLGLVALAATAHAQLLTDTFSYPDGALVGASGSPWVSTGGIAGQLNVVGGELFLDDADTEDAAAPFSSAATFGTLTATFNFRNDADEPSVAAGDHIASFLTTGGAGTQVGLFVLADSDPNQFLIGVATGTGGTPVFFANPFNEAVNLSITLSYDFATDLASVSVAGFGTVTATDTVAATSIDRFQWRQGLSTHGDQFVDNLSVVPEPATWMLMGLGLLLGAQRLRRKSS